MKTLFVLALLLTVCSSAFAYGHGISDESGDSNSYGHGISNEDNSSNTYHRRAWNEF